MTVDSREGEDRVNRRGRGEKIEEHLVEVDLSRVEEGVHDLNDAFKEMRNVEKREVGDEEEEREMKQKRLIPRPRDQSSS